jgi:U6 snRNA-associated Sm-like protein LSm8
MDQFSVLQDRMFHTESHVKKFFLLSPGRSLTKLLAVEAVSLLTIDGRHLVGIFKGSDAQWNMIIDECEERTYSLNAPVKVTDLGLYIVRGDSVVLLGPVDAEKEAKVDLKTIRASPLPSLHLHGV